MAGQSWTPLLPITYFPAAWNPSKVDYCYGTVVASWCHTLQLFENWPDEMYEQTYYQEINEMYENLRQQQQQLFFQI